MHAPALRRPLGDPVSLVFLYSVSLFKIAGRELRGHKKLEWDEKEMIRVRARKHNCCALLEKSVSACG